MEKIRDKQSIIRIFSLEPFFANIALGATASLVTIVATGIGGLAAGNAGGIFGMASGLAASGWGLSCIDSVKRNFRVIPFALGFALGTTGLFQLGEHVGARKPHAPAVAARSVTIPYGPVQPAAMQLRCQRPQTLKA